MQIEKQVASIAKVQKLAKEENEDFSKAWNYVDQKSGKFVDELIRLARQPSVSAQNLGLKECAELVRSMMESLGIKTEMVSITDAPQVVYGELRSNEKNARTLVIYNHYDVRPAEPLSEWRTEPFKPQVADGKIYGRGVGDDKGEIVARFCAIQTLLETGSSVRPNIKWVIEGEEETGSRHFHEFVLKRRSLLKGDGCLWEGCDRSTKGTPEVSLGTKGLLYVEFRVKVGQRDQHSIYGPIAPNPAWRLVDLLKTIRDENGQILIDGFYDDVQKPTALERKFLMNNEFDSEELRKTLNIDYLIEGKDDLETMTNLLYSPTANIAGFGAGYTAEGAQAIIPREAFVKMDYRLVANMKAKDILEKIKGHLKSKGFNDVEVVVHSMDDPAKTSVESHIAQTIIRCTTLVTGKQPNVWPTSPGTGILSLFTDKLKLETAMGLGVSYSGSGFHAPNEHIRIEDYKQAIKQLVCLFRLF
jgi:acetylornithine deacetylase/succinyl-diaminopimelate desuccinylase-like protein